MTRRGFLPTLAVCFGSVCAFAQEPQPLTHIAIYRVKSDKVSDWVALTKKLYVPVLEKLFQEGAVLAYAVNTQMLHSTTEPNVDAWFTVPDWAAYSKAQKAIQKAQTDNRALVLQLAAIADMDKHFDLLVRTPIGKGKAASAGTELVMLSSRNKVKPGKGADYRKLYEKYEVPVLEKLFSDGVILGYGMDQEQEHTMGMGVRWTWVMLPDLAARDKLREAMAAATGSVSESARAEITAAYREVLDWDGHQDTITQSTVFASKAWESK